MLKNVRKLTVSGDKQDSIQNSVFVLKNELLRYSEKLINSDSDNKSNIADVIYDVMLKMGQQENNEDDIKELRKVFQAVPLRYHVQVLRSFIDSYYIKNQLGTTVIAGNAKSDEIVNELMATTNNFYLEKNKILSPFEVLYLTIQAYLEPNTLKNVKRREQASLLFGDIKFQKRILNDYLEEYEGKFDSKFGEGSTANEEI